MKKQLNKIYIVQKGDSLEKISSLYNIKPLSILLYNNITPSMIKEGIVLFIPS